MKTKALFAVVLILTYPFTLMWMWLVWYFPDQPQSWPSWWLGVACEIFLVWNQYRLHKNMRGVRREFLAKHPEDRTAWDWYA
jgi:hypothetical protein